MWVRIHTAPRLAPRDRPDLQGPGYMWAGHPDRNKEAGSEAESQGTLLRFGCCIRGHICALGLPRPLPGLLHRPWFALPTPTKYFPFPSAALSDWVEGPTLCLRPGKTEGPLLM